MKSANEAYNFHFFVTTPHQVRMSIRNLKYTFCITGGIKKAEVTEEGIPNLLAELEENTLYTLKSNKRKDRYEM